MKHLTFVIIFIVGLFAGGYVKFELRERESNQSIKVLPMQFIQQSGGQVPQARGGNCGG